MLYIFVSLKWGICNASPFLGTCLWRRMPAGMIHPFVSASWFIYEYIICSVLLYDDITRFISLQFDYGILKIHLVFMLDSDDISLDGLEQELEECKNDDVWSFPLKIHSFRYIFFYQRSFKLQFFVYFISFAFSCTFLLCFIM